jgi:hypothetical protein
VPNPVPPNPETHWAYHHNPMQQVFVFTNASHAQIPGDQFVVFAEVYPSASETPDVPAYGPTLVYPLKQWYSRFDPVVPIDPNVPVTLVMNKPVEDYTLAELAHMKSILDRSPKGSSIDPNFTKNG